MDEVNRRALLREVHKSQATCKVLRAGIMTGARYCTYPRWVPYPRSDGSITWHHERLKLGKSLITAFSREFDSDAERGSYWRRTYAVHRVQRVEDAETALYDERVAPENLEEAASVLAELVMSLQIILIHAQEYGFCWAWLKSKDGPAGTQELVGSPLDKALVERSVGRPSDHQFSLREQAAAWLERTKISYVGDERQPGDRPPSTTE